MELVCVFLCQSENVPFIESAIHSYYYALLSLRNMQFDLLCVLAIYLHVSKH